MNHTSLILGTIIIFLSAGLGYMTIPDIINQSEQEEESMTAEDTVSAAMPSDDTDSESSDERVRHEEEDEDEEREYELEIEYEDADDEPTPNATLSQTPAPITTPSAPAANGYTLAQVAQHATESSCWSAINDSVYDLTAYITKHPGGKKNILKICGKDGTAAFTGQHGGDGKPENTLERYVIGPLI